MNILLICTGNTCRSPMAQAILKDILARRGMAGVSVTSAGLCAFSGEGASEHAIAAMHEVGLDISAHVATKLCDGALSNADVVYTMTQAQKDAVCVAFPEHAGKTFVLCCNRDVTDPFGGGICEYRECRDQLVQELSKKSDLVCGANCAENKGEQFGDNLKNIQNIASAQQAHFGSTACSNASPTFIGDTSYTLEPLCADHIDGIVAIEPLCFTVPWTRNMFEQELHNKLAVYVVALCDGVVCGYGGMWHIVDEGHITNIAVAPLHQRRGVADKIFGYFEKYAVDNNIEFMTLEVRVGNVAAQELYKKHGFRRAGTRPGYYEDNGEDAIIMVRSRI